MQVISEKNPHTLVFDAGGGWQKNKNIYPTIFYRNYIGYHASSLSSHDIVRISENKLTLKAVKEKLKETLLLSNLEFLKVPHRFLSLPIKKYKIFPVGDVKVGVMGITSPKQVVQNFHPSFKGVLFKDPVSTIVETAAHLRKVGADIIVVLYNFGVDCTSQQATEFDLPNHRVNFNYTEAYCDEYKNELTSTLKQLPQLTVDLVITQGMDSKVSNIIYGTAVMQNPIAKGYLGFSEVRYDHHKDRVSDESLIYPPVITCHNFLKNAKDCQLEKNSTLQTVEASFLGVPIPSEAELKSKVFPWEKQKLDL